MAKVKFVTGFVPLNVNHVSQEKYQELGKQLVDAVGAENIVVFNDTLDNCWLTKVFPEELPPHADSRLYPDRYPTPYQMSESSVIQHNRTSWGMQALKQDPSIDTIVWVDYGVLKQGDFTGNPVRAEDIRAFFDRLSEQKLDDIPFPGIWDMMQVGDGDANWRFCGSLHIWPAEYMRDIDDLYKEMTLRFLKRTSRLPYDMTIWADCERRAVLPFRWYRANHDNTQFTNFQHVQKDTPLCALARKYGTDKCEPAHYTPTYFKLLYKRKVHKMLEIGICAKRDFLNHRCGASLWMWSEFFGPEVQVTGIDIDPESMVNEGNIQSFLCDQSNPTQLRMLASTCGPWDLIVDDGSHNPIHQLVSMQTLLPQLNPGGLYIIEDIGNWLYPSTRPQDLVAQVPPGYKTTVYGELPHHFIVIERPE